MKTTNMSALVARIMMGLPSNRLLSNSNSKSILAQSLYQEPEPAHCHNGGRPMFKQNRRAQIKANNRKK